MQLSMELTCRQGSMISRGNSHAHRYPHQAFWSISETWREGGRTGDILWGHETPHVLGPSGSTSHSTGKGRSPSLGEDNGHVFFSLLPQRANKGSKNMERLKKKLSEQESLLLLMSPNMAFRVHNRNGKVRHDAEQYFGLNACCLTMLSCVVIFKNCLPK